ncbi:MAG: CopG family transcriptional regulator [Thermoprotei archaeon]|nr:MAG: CopG family transcriptional regulator [Thermoprotei archaeon]
MNTQVVPIRLDDEILSFIDLLIKLGVYRSRSEALRELIRIGISSLGGMVEVVRAVDKLFEKEKEIGDIPIKLDGVLKEFLKERERF